jgi:hypothetical protein
LVTGALGPEEGRRLPLLTLLIVSEFGFFVTAIGAFMAVRSLVRQAFALSLVAVAVGCTSLAGAFMWLGMTLWPGGFPSSG